MLSTAWKKSSWIKYKFKIRLWSSNRMIWPSTTCFRKRTANCSMKTMTTSRIWSDHSFNHSKVAQNLQSIRKKARTRRNKLWSCLVILWMTLSSYGSTSMMNWSHRWHWIYRKYLGLPSAPCHLSSHSSRLRNAHPSKKVSNHYLIKFNNPKLKIRKHMKCKKWFCLKMLILSLMTKKKTSICSWQSSYSKAKCQYCWRRVIQRSWTMSLSILIFGARLSEMTLRIPYLKKLLSMKWKASCLKWNQMMKCPK